MAFVHLLAPNITCVDFFRQDLTIQLFLNWFILIFITHSIVDCHNYIFIWPLIIRVRINLEITDQKVDWSFIVGLLSYLVVRNWIKHFNNSERMHSSLKALNFYFNYRNNHSINFTTSIRMGFSSEMLVHCISKTVEEFIWIVEFTRTIRDQVGYSGISCN